MHFITDFADEAVVLPITSVVGVMLCLLGWRRGAVAWVVVICCTLFAILLLKLIGIACGPDHFPRMRTPSGHTAAAAVLAGSFAALFTRRRRCTVAMVTACAAAGVIGVSRYMLGSHTIFEVLAGAIVGISGAIAFAYTAGPAPCMQLRPVALSAALMVAIFHGHRVNVEPDIWRASYWFSRRLRVCRADEPRYRFYSHSVGDCPVRPAFRKICDNCASICGGDSGAKRPVMPEHFGR